LIDGKWSRQEGGIRVVVVEQGAAKQIPLVMARRVEAESEAAQVATESVEEVEA
jgi:hypothetical protein